MYTNNLISDKDKTVAGILGLVLGFIGIHRMYMGYIGLGILQFFLFFFTFGLSGIWGFVEGILILVQDDWTDAQGRLLRGNEKVVYHTQQPTQPIIQIQHHSAQPAQNQTYSNTPPQHGGLGELFGRNEVPHPPNSTKPQTQVIGSNLKQTHLDRAHRLEIEGDLEGAITAYELAEEFREAQRVRWAFGSSRNDDSNSPGNVNISIGKVGDTSVQDSVITGSEEI